MSRDAPRNLNIHVEEKPRRATKRPKSVGSKTVATATGAKVRVNALDANSATFGADFLYVFKNNVRRARERGRAAKPKPPKPTDAK